MIHPVVCNPVLNPKVGILNPPRWRAGRLAPDGAILHWDADIDAFSEQTGGVHTFNHNVLSPQYQRSADGSYANAGAKPAVDAFDGKKWLRSCGAVQNLFSSGVEDFSSSNWSKVNATIAGNVGTQTITFSDVVTARVYRTKTGFGTVAGHFSVELAGTPGEVIAIEFDTVRVDVTLTSTLTRYYVFGTCTVTDLICRIIRRDATHALSVIAARPMLSTLTYPVPYVPPGVTQPASSATTTNGVWFSLPDGSPLWQALTGQPLTLATRVRMGVGSGDILSMEWPAVIHCGANRIINYGKDAAGFGATVSTYDGTAYRTYRSEWSRNSIIRRITQVNTAGTQFRVGYMIEGTHTTIQWINWANFDGSFNPSTIYRLMLGFNNAYPMWFNKVTAWKKQVTDAEILEAMA